MSRYMVLGKLLGANFNVTTDQAIPMLYGHAVVADIIVTNASTSLTTAAGGFYTAASKGGTAIVAAGQAYSALTGAGVALKCTIAVAQRVTSAGQIFLSLTTGQGSAATADVYVLGVEADG